MKASIPGKIPFESSVSNPCLTPRRTDSRTVGLQMVLFGRALTVLSILSITSATVSPPMRVSFRPPSLARVRTAYKQFSEEHYMPIARAYSPNPARVGGRRVAGAARVPLDMHHMAAYGTLGVLFSGLVGRSWLASSREPIGAGNHAQGRRHQDGGRLFLLRAVRKQRVPLHGPLPDGPLRAARSISPPPPRASSTVLPRRWPSRPRSSRRTTSSRSG